MTIWSLADLTAKELQYGTFDLTAKVAGGQVVALEIRNVVRKMSLDDVKKLHDEGLCNHSQP